MLIMGFYMISLYNVLVLLIWWASLLIVGKYVSCLIWGGEGHTNMMTISFSFVLQVMGTDEGYTFMEEVENKLLLLISMPLIPVLLVLGRMIQWEDMVLKLWRRHAPRFLTKLFSNSVYRFSIYTLNVLRTVLWLSSWKNKKNDKI